MHEPSKDTSQMGRRQGSWVGCLLLAAAVMGGSIYYLFYGFWGLNTVRYVPVPDNLVRDQIAAPGGDWSTERRNRFYEARYSVDELVAFYQQALPQSGWGIVGQGGRQILDAPAYCFRAEQRHVFADIELVEIPEDKITRVWIHLDRPDLCGPYLRD